MNIPSYARGPQGISWTYSMVMEPTHKALQQRWARHTRDRQPTLREWLPPRHQELSGPVPKRMHWPSPNWWVTHQLIGPSETNQWELYP